MLFFAAVLLYYRTMSGEYYYKKRLNIAHWNIEGHKNSTVCKFNDQQFVNELTKHDIIALTETHAGPDADLSVDGYFTYTTSRAKHRKARKYSGGIAILIRDYLLRGTEIKRSSSELVWVKLDKSFFNLSEDFYIGVVYLSPKSSQCTRGLSENTWNQLEKDICQYNDLGKIVLLGDYNSRVGTISDFIIQDDNKYTPNGDTYISDANVREKCSMDACVNDYGKKLIEICRNARLRIANGRVLGDLNGNLTCFQWNGCSVVDYCIVHEDLLGVIEYFRVHDFKGMFSNHCKVSLQIPSDVKIIKNKQITVEFPNSCRWSDEVALQFSTALQSEDFRNSLKSIDNDITVGNNTNDIIESFADALVSAVHICANKKTKKYARKRKHKKWYDSDCRDLKRSLNKTNRQFIRAPWDVSVRELFFRQRKQYKKVLKYKEKH